jgi:hypothetical protein
MMRVDKQLNLSTTSAKLVINIFFMQDDLRENIRN